MPAYDLLPLGARVVCLVRRMPEKTESGIILPQTARDEHHGAEADVISIGADVKSIQVDDHIIFNEFTGAEVEVDGVHYKILREEDILAKVVEKPS